jgi:ureidoglycolate lyase
MPPTPITIPTNIVVTSQPLDPVGFASFGEVIENSNPDLHPSALGPGRPTAATPPNAVSANQGTAIKYADISQLTDLYAQAPSRHPSKPAISMFVCAARQLPQTVSGAGTNMSTRNDAVFPISVLERHPFTSQTFIPLVSKPGRKYLVVVAPSLPPSPNDAHLPSPASPPSISEDVRSNVRNLPGSGFPVLGRIRAFVGTAGQAVTYGPGTWHAPMIALGQSGTAVDFVVVQFVNGVALEDCQEVVFISSEGKECSLGVRILDVDGAAPPKL